MTNELKEIQISILKDNLAVLNNMKRLRNDLCICKTVHNKLSVIGQRINMGRIKNLKYEIERCKEMIKGI
jgi:hypothetical protein